MIPVERGRWAAARGASVWRGARGVTRELQMAGPGGSRPPADPVRRQGQLNHTAGCVGHCRAETIVGNADVTLIGHTVTNLTFLIMALAFH